VTGFIDHFNARLVTTFTYSANDNIHSLKITRAHTKFSPECSVFTSPFLVTASNNGDFSAFALTPYLPATVSQLNSLLQPNNSQAGGHLTTTFYSSIYWLTQNQSYFTTGGLPPISSSWRQASWDPRPVFFFLKLNICNYSPYVTSSLTRGRVCRYQLLLVLASRVILRTEVHGTHYLILLSQIRDSPKPGWLGLRVYIPQERGGPVIPSDTGFPFHCLLLLAGLWWRYSNAPPHGILD
jgi:hypothetical protein